MKDSKEILDLVNAHDEVIGAETRENVYAHALHNFRLVYAVIENDSGQLWVPRRAAHKIITPLHLDGTIGGHVMSGESYEEALSRELAEEVVLRVEDEDTTYLGKLTPERDDSYAHAKVWKIRRNQAPSFNPDDFSEASWMTPQEVLDRQQQGDKIKSDFIVVLHRFFNT